MPEARIVSEDDDPGRKYIDNLVHAEPALPADMEEEKGFVGWIKRNKSLAAIIVLVILGAVVGGAVGVSLDLVGHHPQRRQLLHPQTRLLQRRRPLDLSSFLKHCQKSRPYPQ